MAGLQAGHGFRSTPPPGRILAGTAGSWVPDEELRRLAAYKVAAAYDQGQAGQLAAAVSGDDGDADRRKFGDSAKLIDTALGYLLCAEQTITVAGAEHADDDDRPKGAAQAAEVRSGFGTGRRRSCCRCGSSRLSGRRCAAATACT